MSAADAPDPSAPNAASSTRRTTLLIALGVGSVLTLLIVLLAMSPSGRGTKLYSSVLDEVAPVTTGETLDGGQMDLRDMRGQWVLVNFFATWCAGCIQEHPELVEFHERHAAIGDASVVSVVYEDSASDVAEFFENRGGDWPVIFNDGVALEYGVVAVPESYLVAPSGRVVAKFIGATGVTADNLDATIAEITSPSAASNGDE